ncbi:AMP-binding protein, partial [Streptomyces chryseus]
MSSLFPALAAGSNRQALRFGDRSLTHAELAAAAGVTAGRLRGPERVAVWATAALETAVGVVGALLAGVPAVPLNPRTGARELEHIVADSAPSRVLAAPGDRLPPVLDALGGGVVRRRAAGGGARSPAAPAP